MFKLDKTGLYFLYNNAKRTDVLSSFKTFAQRKKNHRKSSSTWNPITKSYNQRMIIYTYDTNFKRNFIIIFSKKST